jgi:hypothetical protein
MVVLLKEKIYTREVYRKQGENRIQLSAASLKKKGPRQPEIENSGAGAAFVIPLVN